MSRAGLGESSVKKRKEWDRRVLQQSFCTAGRRFRSKTVAQINLQLRSGQNQYQGATWMDVLVNSAGSLVLDQ